MDITLFTQDFFLLVVGLSTLFQIGVAALSTFITRKASFCRDGWMVISIAFWMMAIRRISVAYEIMTNRDIAYYYWPELVGLFLSAGLIHGLWKLNSCFTEEIHNLSALAEEMPAMVSILNNVGYATYLNKKWYEYTGSGKSDSLGYAWHQFVHPDDLAKVWDYWRLCLEQACAYEAKVRVRNKEGKYRWHLARALPLKNERGEVHTWFGTMIDVENYILDKETIYGR